MPPSLSIMGPRPEGPPSSGSARSDPPPHVTQSPLPTGSLKSRRSMNRCFTGPYLAHAYVEWAAGGYSQCESPGGSSDGPRIRNASWRRLVLVCSLVTTSTGARSQETEPLEDQGTKADRSSGSLPAQDGRESERPKSRPVAPGSVPLGPAKGFAHAIPAEAERCRAWASDSECAPCSRGNPAALALGPRGSIRPPAARRSLRTLGPDGRSIGLTRGL